MNRAWSVAASVVLTLAVPATGVAQALKPQTAPATKSVKPAKPKVPIGVDPGGIPVAFIGPGLDYTQPDIAENLARDGEGELIGFDLIAQDRKPFAKQDAPADHETLTTFIDAVLTQSIDIKLQVFKTTNRDTQMIARAIQMAAQANARIIVIWAPPVTGTLPDVARDDVFLAAARTRFSTITFLPAPVVTEAAVQPTDNPDGAPLAPGDLLPHAATIKLVKSLRAMDTLLRSKPDAQATELTAAIEP